MTKLINLETNTITDCEFLKYQLDEAVGKSITGIVSQFVLIERLVDDLPEDKRSLNACMLQAGKTVQEIGEPLNVALRALQSSLRSLALVRGRHRINGYFWCMEKAHPSFEVISLTTSLDDEVSTTYKIKLSNCVVSFSVHHHNVSFPKDKAAILPGQI
jgi:hypothetical protein